MLRFFIQNLPMFILIAIAVAIIMVCFPFLNGNDDHKPQSIFIAVLLSVAVSLIMILAERGINAYIRKRQFSYLIHDDYKSYSFTGSTIDEIKFTSTTLEANENKVKCKIISGDGCDLEMWVSADNGEDDWTWRGLITMTSPNTGEMAYYHTKDSNLSENGINSAGYKRLTAFERQEPHEIRIMISQNDKNKNFGREVFIATLPQSHK
jgi:hypothetical protein